MTAVKIIVGAALLLLTLLLYLCIVLSSKADEREQELWQKHFKKTERR